MYIMIEKLDTQHRKIIEQQWSMISTEMKNERDRGFNIYTICIYIYSMAEQNIFV